MIRPALVVAAGLLVPLALACSGEVGAESSSTDAQETLPSPSEAGLVTPEEAAQTAAESIDASNAENELQKLQQEIDQG